MKNKIRYIGRLVKIADNFINDECAFEVSYTGQTRAVNCIIYTKNTFGPEIVFNFNPESIDNNKWLKIVEAIEKVLKDIEKYDIEKVIELLPFRSGIYVDIDKLITEKEIKDA